MNKRTFLKTLAVSPTALIPVTYAVAEPRSKYTIENLKSGVIGVLEDHYLEPFDGITMSKIREACIPYIMLVENSGATSFAWVKCDGENNNYQPYRDKGFLRLDLYWRTKGAEGYEQSTFYSITGGPREVETITHKGNLNPKEDRWMYIDDVKYKVIKVNNATSFDAVKI